MIIETIKKEIKAFLTEEIEISPGHWYSHWELIKRINRFQNRVFPGGNVDSQNDYIFWTDIITPRVNNEIKNIDFDTSAVSVHTELKADSAPTYITNLALKEWMRNNGQGDELNDSIEYGSGWGNCLWKKTQDGYKRLDLMNVILTNTAAEKIKDTAVIERHLLTPSELRAKDGTWENIDEVMETCGSKNFFNTLSDKNVNIEESSIPRYEIYERNGEISTEELYEAQGKTGGNEYDYVYAKIVVAGLKGEDDNTDGDKILYAEKLSKKEWEDMYVEYHRSRYKGRWLREGVIELLFDHQIRANTISNQIAKGLKWASKVIFRTSDNLIAANVTTDMLNGEIIKSKDLAQVDVRLHNLDQLIADWNRLMQSADNICNSPDILQGNNMPFGTPFRLGATLNVNAAKIFEFIREKMGLSFKAIFEKWIVPSLIKELKQKDILRLTGNDGYVRLFYTLAVEGWYRRNLVYLPPHTQQQSVAIKQAKLTEIMAKPDKFISYSKELFKDFKYRVNVEITGESVNLDSDLASLANFIQMEADPVRRTALIEMAMLRKGMDISMLPKMPPMAMTPAPTQRPSEIERYAPQGKEAVAV